MTTGEARLNHTSRIPGENKDDQKGLEEGARTALLKAHVSVFSAEATEKDVRLRDTKKTIPSHGHD